MAGTDDTEVPLPREEEEEAGTVTPSEAERACLPAWEVEACLAVSTKFLSEVMVSWLISERLSLPSCWLWSAESSVRTVAVGDRI